MKHAAVAILSLFILLGCSVQKRKYQKGYYLAWKKPAAVQKALSSQHKLPAAAAAKQQPATPALQEITRQLSSVSSAPATTAQRREKKPVQADDPCDEIIFKDGRELKGKVTEITQTEIKYRKCDMPDGPVYVVKKTEVFMIRYANGSKDVFKEEETKARPPSAGTASTIKVIKTHPLAEAALVLGIASFVTVFFGIICAILAIVLGGKAIRQINADPISYRGLNLATTGRVLGVIYISLLVLLLAFLFFAVAFI